MNLMLRCVAVLCLLPIASVVLADDPPSAAVLEVAKKLAAVGKLTDASLKPFATANDEVRKELIGSLKQTKISDDNRVVLLQFALKKDANDDVRQAAAGALSKMVGLPAANKALVEMLGDKSPQLRQIACDAFYGFRGDPTLSVKVAKLLTDEAPAVRLAAVHTLGKLNDRKQVPAIIASYKKFKKESDDDSPYAEALALLGETDVSLEVARFCMKSRNQAARMAALTAIECNPSTPKTVPLLMDNLILELNRTIKLDPTKKDWDIVYVSMCSELIRRSGQNYGLDAIGWYMWWDGVRAKYDAPAPAFDRTLVTRWMETYRKMGPSKVKE